MILKKLTYSLICTLILISKIDGRKVMIHNPDLFNPAPPVMVDNKAIRLGRTEAKPAEITKDSIISNAINGPDIIKKIIENDKLEILVYPAVILETTPSQF